MSASTSKKCLRHFFDTQRVSCLLEQDALFVFTAEQGLWYNQKTHKRKAEAALGMFGFDERYAMFDMTAVDNQFILEYLPSASGDQVKVYLYGLMQCCHPQADMTLEQLARELEMTEDSVQAAYRYWERKGLVQRISDRPPCYRYVNVKQLMLSGAASPADPEYDLFSEAVQSLFEQDRKIHGKEMQLCYEWVEDMGLPQEVVLTLLAFMKETKGKSFTFKSAQKTAVELAEAGIATATDAEHYLQLEKDVLRGSRDVLKRMGQYRNPTVDEQNLYRKWLKEWGFKPDAILEACADTTGGKPSFKYLNGILNKYHEKDATSGAQLREIRQSGDSAVQPLKKLLAIFNIATLTINEDTLAQYARMQELYPDEVIQLAARECAGRGLDFEDTLKTLRSWKRQGLRDRAEIEESLRQVNRQNSFLEQLFALWGRRSRPTAADRKLLTRWTEEWRFGEEMIIATAAYAANAEKPMPYLDKLLEDFARRSIATPEQAAAERAEHQQKAAAPAARPVKTVREQQYTQREYVHTDDGLNQMMARWKEEQGDAQ